MKKILSLVLAAVLCLLLCACGETASVASEAPAEESAAVEESVAADEAAVAAEAAAAAEKAAEEAAEEAAESTGNLLSVEDSGFYDMLVSAMDENFGETPHSVTYNEAESAIYIVVQAPDGSRTYLALENQDLLDAWQENVDAFVSMTQVTYDGCVGLIDLDHVHMYYVDELKVSGEYSENEILLWAENGIVRYNVVDGTGSNVSANVGSTSAGSDTESTSSASSGASSGSTSYGTATAGEKNALDSAKNYLSVLPFSYTGLIEQLEYEGFSTAEATYGADHCGADWNEQALKKAGSYLDVMAFSYSGLIEQLEYEGFTTEQATYGADRCGANWEEQAAEKAQSYLEIMSFSKSDLIEQLEFEGFTHAQAVYGVEKTYK